MDEYIEKQEEKTKKKIRKNIKRIEKQRLRQERSFKDRVFFFLKVSIITTIILMTIVIFTTVGLFYYFNEYAYDNTITYMSLESFLEKESQYAIQYKSTDSVNVAFNEDIFNSILIKNKEIIENYIDYDYNILDLYIDLEEKVTYVNGRIGITLMPLSATFDMAVDDDYLVITLNNILVGSEGLILPDLIMDLFMKQNDVEIKVPLEALEIFPEYLKIKNLFIQEDSVVFNTSIELKEIADYLATYNSYTEPIILDDYERHPTKDNKIVLKALQGDLHDEEIRNFIDDIFSQQIILNKFIVALDATGIENLYNEYGFIIKSSVEDLYKTKGETVIIKKVEIAHVLLIYLEDYLSNNNISLFNDSGMLYDLERQEHITVQSTSTLYNVPSEVFRQEINNCSYYYDTTNDEIIVKYHLNDNQVLIVSKTYYEIISSKEADNKYSTKTRMDKGTELFRDSEEAMLIKQGIQAYVETEDDLYFRYLKSDGMDAYAIVSFENTYQSVHSYALKKVQQEWEVLKHDLPYQALNSDYQEFNIKLLPSYEYREIKIKQISKYGKQTIIDQLRVKGVYNGGSILLCSYIGDYVYVYLSDGSEYVIQTKGGTLTDVLTREEAEKLSELSPILMLIPQA